MPPTKLSHPSPGVPYPQGERVRPVLEEFAKRAGVSVHRARRILYEHPRLTDCIRAARETYRALGNERALARLDVAMQAGETVPERVTAPLLLEAQTADVATETAITAFVCRPSRETAGAAFAALMHQRAECDRLAIALSGQYAL